MPYKITVELDSKKHNIAFSGEVIGEMDDHEKRVGARLIRVISLILDAETDDGVSRMFNDEDTGEA